MRNHKERIEKLNTIKRAKTLIKVQIEEERERLHRLLDNGEQEDLIVSANEISHLSSRLMNLDMAVNKIRWEM